MAGLKFSICHTTARPNGWHDAHQAWMYNAALPGNVEYVLVCDQRWGFTELPKLRPQDKTAWNIGRKCWVDGVNIACAASTGLVQIINADDMFPPPHWDQELLAVIPDLATDFVIQTTSGTPADDRGLFVVQIQSRARYLRLGYGIGSGAVESAHKQVVHARFRQAGMRWSEAGARRLLALRLLLLNNNWALLDRLPMVSVA